MSSFQRKFKTLVQDRYLRNSILFTLVMLIAFRFLASIPVPGVNPGVLAQFLANNQFFSFLNLFSGGGLSQLSIVVLGVGPYITSSIIMQLMTTVSPKLKRLFHEEGSIGRKKFNNFSRLLTVPIALVQGVGILTLLSNQGALPELGLFGMVTNVLVITAGAMLVTWLGELITEFGVGNGVSLLIFAGIVASVPSVLSQLSQSYIPSELFNYVIYALVVLLVIVVVVMVNEAERRVGITYAKQVRGMSTYGGSDTYVPVKVNQAGVMPIIFALSILLFPQMIAGWFATSDIVWLAQASNSLNLFLQDPFWYPAIYFILVFGFTYFYTAITFDPEAMAENLHKSGAFVPGTRPGASTEEYFAKVANRLTFVGALFLSIIAVLPIVIAQFFPIGATASVAIGGTGILIVVSVVLDLIKKLDAQIAMRQY
ncbi:preprotein translocase subunit SecY [Candidatus Campbellbacteria bacterium]|nr:preprotein translocase subunit SecY [Candidatus Campbellbacteria bacterium]|tara:strand:+ start:2860 stop:4140 length:1281 start_codon:yes stop_codon:yes gene_type:complete